VFQGGTSGLEAQIDGSGKLYIPTPNVDLQLNYEIPIFVGNDVEGTIVYYRDEDGNLQFGENFYVWDGYMMFHKDWAGVNGQIILYRGYQSNHRRTAIDIQSGKEVILQDVAAQGQFGLRNYIEVNDANLSVGSPMVVSPAFVVSYDGSDAPVIRVALSNARTVYVTNCKVGAWNVYPTKLEVRAPDGTVTTVPFSQTELKGQFNAQPGIYWVMPVYDDPNLFGAGQEPQPTYYGGKG
jgi:hypothetical protein